VSNTAPALAIAESLAGLDLVQSGAVLAIAAGLADVAIADVLAALVVEDCDC
jgi:hypothetical protein